MTSRPTSLPPDPGPRRPTDLRRMLVLPAPPWKDLGLRSEAEFEPATGRYLAGSYRMPDGNLIQVAVDPAMPADAYVLEDALTGAVVRRGRLGESR